MHIDKWTPLSSSNQPQRYSTPIVLLWSLNALRSDWPPNWPDQLKYSQVLLETLSSAWSPQKRQPSSTKSSFYKFIPEKKTVPCQTSRSSKPCGSIFDLVLLTAKGTLLWESSSSSLIGWSAKPPPSFFLIVRRLTVAFLSPYLLWQEISVETNFFRKSVWKQTF